MATKHDILVSWLNDAYAMEQNLIEVLESQVKHAEEHPEIKRHLETHLEETQRHSEIVEECLHRLDSDSSAGKKLIGKMTGWVQGAGSSASDDALVKDCLAGYSMEHFEIASYRSLVAAAEEAGETEVAEACRAILQDEQRMAEFLEQQIPRVTQMHLSQQAAV